MQKHGIYNRDEKGFMQGVVAKVRDMISKYETQQHTTQPLNREWLALMLCVSMYGRALRPGVIFRAKLHQMAWYDVL